MRTIDQAMAEIVKQDPDTAFTKNALRQMVISGKLDGVVMIGRKYLLNMDALEAYLRGGVYDVKQ